MFSMCLGSCAFGLRTDDVGGARTPPPTELVALFERHPQRISEGVGQSVDGCLQFGVRSDLETSMDRLGITRAEVEKWDLGRLHIFVARSRASENSCETIALSLEYRDHNAPPDLQIPTSPFLTFNKLIL